MNDVYELTDASETTSVIFQNIFNKTRELYLQRHKGHEATMQVAIKELWQPAYDEFSNDLKSLIDDLKLPLKKVDYIFKGLSSQNELKNQLLLWCNAMHEGNKDWITDAAQKILDYQELRRYSYTAQTLMKLKEKLELSGDFSAVEALLSKEEV